MLCLQAAAALQKLLAAVRVLDIVEVSRLLKLGAPVNEPNPDIDVSHMNCVLAAPNRLKWCKHACQNITHDFGTNC